MNETNIVPGQEVELDHRDVGTVDGTVIAAPDSLSADSQIIVEAKIENPAAMDPRNDVFHTESEKETEIHFVNPRHITVLNATGPHSESDSEPADAILA